METLRSLVPLFVLFTSAPLLVAQEGRKRPDYGPVRAATVSDSWSPLNTVPKGLVIGLSVGAPWREDAGLVFDSDLLRASCTWRATRPGAYMEWKGTAYDGRHGTNPSIRGGQYSATAPLPSLVPSSGKADPRSIPYGPVPASLGKWHGYYLSGREVTLSYALAGRELLEHPRALGKRGGAISVAREFEVAAGKQKLTMRAAVRSGARLSLDTERRAAFFRTVRKPEGLVRMRRATSGWEALRFGPSAHDYADRASGHGVTMEFVKAISSPHPRAGAKESSLPRLFDGDAAQNRDDTSRNVWFDAAEGRIHVDLRKSIEILSIQSYSWHASDRAPQRFTLYGSASDAADPAAKNPSAASWTKIADVNTERLGQGGQHEVVIQKPKGTLGQFRHLLFVCRKGHGSGTFFSEIDVYRPDDPREESADYAAGPALTAVRVTGDPGVRLVRAGEELRVVVPTGATSFTLHHWSGPEAKLGEFQSILAAYEPTASLAKLLKPNGQRWPEILETKGRLAEDDAAYVVDSLTHPKTNPWGSDFRFGDFEFFEDGTRAAITTWNGDVWIVSGISKGLEKLRWKRFATGLYDPLGIQVVDDEVYVHGRDQITILRDLDKDGEADFHECFFNGIYVTKSFHEFSYELRTDAEGNFYFSKGGPVRPGGRGFETITPHHGCCFRLSKDGKKLEILATGLRAPNGIGVRADGLVTTGDNEGTWMPKCRLNMFRKGYFAGCVDTSHRDPLPKTYDKPLCWMPMYIDNSSGGQTWVTSSEWGPFKDRLLHLSYGQCALYLVSYRELRPGLFQGGVVKFPLSFASSLMRGRFNEKDGQLYVSGLKGWQTRAAKRTAFQRVRYTGKKIRMLADFEVAKHGIYLHYSCKLDRELAEDPRSYSAEMWNYLWSSAYGSPELSVLHPERKGHTNSAKVRDPLEVKSAKLLPDGQSVYLDIPGLRPAMQVRVTWDLEDSEEEPLVSEVHLTVHELGTRGAPKD